VRFDNAFDVQAPIDQVWTAMLDVERVAPCVPGAEVLERLSDDSYRVGIKIRIGPIVQQYRGDIEIVEKDESARRSVMRARAREMRGQGRAEGRVELRLTEEGSQTHGDMTAEVSLSGPAAAMGRGIIQDVSARIVEAFSKNLAAMLAGGPAAPTAEAPAMAEPIPDVAAPDEPTRELPAMPAPSAETAIPDVAAPDEPTRALPAVGAAAPLVGPDTASPPQSGVTAARPPGAAEEAALGPAAAIPSDEVPAPPPAPAPSAEEPAPPPPPPPLTPDPAAPPRAESEAALPVLAIVGDVALKRLREPKVIGTIAAVAVVGLMLRRRRRR
jgi:uncharacterized protein